MLYDTGSAFTCMSAKEFGKLHPRDVVSMKTADVNLVFTSASGDPIVANQKSIVRFRMLERMIEYPVYIVDKLHEPFIMGIDFIKDMNLGYCPSHQEFFWTGNCPREHVVTLGLKDAVTIPAFGKRRCKVKIANQKLVGKSVVASVLMEAQPWIRGERFNGCR